MKLRVSGPEQTVVRLARNNRRSGITACYQCLTGIQSQPAFNCLAAMTLKTWLNQHRPHPAFKISHRVFIGCVETH